MQSVKTATPFSEMIATIKKYLSKIPLTSLNRKISSFDDLLRCHVSVLYLCLAFLVLFSCWLRIASYEANPAVSRDACYYIALVEDYCNGRWHDGTPEVDYYCYILPFLPHITAKIASTGCTVETAWRSMNIVLGSLLPFLIYLIARQLKMSPLEALSLGLLAAVHPLLLKYSYEIQREMFFLFWAACAFYLVLLSINTHRVFFYFLAGISLGFALQARYETLFLFVSTAVYLCYAWKESKITGKTAIFEFCFMVAGFCICLLCIGRITSFNLLFLTNTIQRKIGYFLSMF